MVGGLHPGPRSFLWSSYPAALRGCPERPWLKSIGSLRWRSTLLAVMQRAISPWQPRPHLDTGLGFKLLNVA